MNIKISGILLAAGQSKRFEGNKLLQSLTDGRSMLEHSTQNMLPHVDQLICVISPVLQETMENIQHDKISHVICDEANKGISASIRCGIINSPAQSSWIIALADMPFIQFETYKEIADELRRGSQIVAPFFQQQQGHPKAFSHIFKNDLLNLHGDKGAAQLLKKYAHQLHSITTFDRGTVSDIDTQEQLLQALQQDI